MVVINNTEDKYWYPSKSESESSDSVCDRACDQIVKDQRQPEHCDLHLQAEHFDDHLQAVHVPQDPVKVFTAL